MGLIELTVGDARVVFTDRHGGVSEPPYDTCNLGLLTDDAPERVLENRRRVGEAVGGSAADPDRWFRIRQVHGDAVVDAGAAHAGVPDADAAVTASAGQPLVVLTADCVPLALAAPGAAGVVHAGWRGLLSGVVEAGVRAVRERAGEADLHAVIGPCIHPERYEFGSAELERVARRLGPSVRASTRSGAPALDLRAGVRAALAGVGVGAVTDVDVCTAASADHFSHRRDGTTGRQALLVVREP